MRFAEGFVSQLKSCAISNIDGTSAITGDSAVVTRKAFNVAELGAKTAFNKALKIIDANSEALVGAGQMQTVRSAFAQYAKRLDTMYSDIIEEIVKQVNSNTKAAQEYAQQVSKVINEVIQGNYGVGAEIKESLFKDGYDVKEIQQGINKIQ